MAKTQILIIGSWQESMQALGSDLSQENYDIQSQIWEGLETNLNLKNKDLCFLCFKNNELSSLIDLISEIKQTDDSLPIMVISDSSDWKSIVQIMKMGVHDYSNFPYNFDELRQSLQQALRRLKLTRKIFSMADIFESASSSFEGMIGQSELMQENFKMIQAVGQSNATVLITGESGTGKELVAQAVHRRSNRKKHRFVDLNCGAIPRDLLENELFGHEKGAFTGAHKRYSGSFEVADKGTLFLDEISEMDPLLQVKLLRVLQERSFMRIGGSEKIDVDVRIIAASNRNLQDSIDKGLFREDLYYRLNVVNIPLPSLRDRREDIPLLAHHFLEYYSTKNNRIFLDFADDAIEALINYDWPGNVRELENTIERVVVLHDDSQVKLKFLPKHVQRVSRSISFKEVSKASGGITEEAQITPLSDLEKKAIEMALIKFQGNISVAAKKLQIGQATLYRKVKKLGLQHLGKMSGVA